MFARTVTVRLKSNAVADFNRTLENEIVPILRKQKGFQDKLTLVPRTERKRSGSACGITNKTPRPINAKPTPRYRSYWRNRLKGLLR